MNYRVGKATVGVVGHVGEVHGRAGQPATQPGPGPRLPFEWPSRGRLAYALSAREKMTTYAQQE